MNKIDKIFYLPKRDLILIENDYELIHNQYEKTNLLNRLKKNRNRDLPIDTHKEDFSVIIYYIDENKIRVKIYRIDDYVLNKNTWTQDLKLKIDCEIINIGNHLDENNIFDKIIILNKIKVKPLVKDLELDIPKRIIQTSFKISDNEYVKKSMNIIIDMNPDFEYYFFNDESIIDFYNQYYPEYIDYHLSLRSGTFQADLFRYCVIYKFGGYYLDYKLFCKYPFSKIKCLKNNINLCIDWSNNNDNYTIKALYNAIIFAKSDSIILKKAIELSIENIKNKRYNNGYFDITGPDILYKSFILNKIEYINHLPFKHKLYHPWNRIQNCIIVDRFTNKILINKPFDIRETKTEYYMELYDQRKLYNNIIEINNIKILIPEYIQFEKKSDDYFYFDLKNQSNIIINIFKDNKIIKNKIEKNEPYLYYNQLISLI